MQPRYSFTHTPNTTSVPTSHDNSAQPSSPLAQQQSTTQTPLIPPTVAHSPTNITTDATQQPPISSLSHSGPSQAQQPPTVSTQPPQPTNPNSVSTHPMVTRYRVGTNRPTQRLTLHVSSVSPLPKSYRDAFNDPNWQHAMNDEYSALIKNNTWTLVPRPTDANIVRCMWLFRHKYLADGTLSRYKARLVANGSTQLEGIDVDETFSPVVKPGTIRTVLSLAVSRHWPIRQLDVKNAFLHGDLSETVYMHQPPGFRDSAHPDYVCLLQRSLYGLKQAPRACFLGDFSLQQIIGSLHQEFCMTDLGPLNYFLGISVTRDSSGVVFISEEICLFEILEMRNMVDCNSCRTPIDTESKLGSDGDLVSNPALYRSLAGSLQYLTFTRPDISYAVQQVCLHMHDPREPHFSALKRILRYVQGTMDYGLQLFASSTTDLVDSLMLLGYAEAEYRGVANTVAETCWICNLLRELHTPLSFATLVYCDNVSVVYLSCNPVQHQRTKHIEIDIHFVRNLVAVGQVRVLHVPSRYQFADIFTKGLPSALFEEFRSSLSVRRPPAPTAGEC
ncbi:ribonuclease H-like domain-containing protein [Tanacetum coccineum]